MITYLLNYSDDRHGHKGGRFRANQLRLNASAIVNGIDHIVSWTWQEFAKTDYYRDNRSFLDRNHFHNGAAFKPYIILTLLESVNPGDIVFYYDCGPYTLRRSIQPLIDLCVANDGILFHQYGDRNLNWTKRDAFFYMGCDTPRYHNATALGATWLFIQRSERNLEFVRRWLFYNSDERIASYVLPDTCGLPPLRGFIQNRGDQSIFSNLAVTYGIRTYYGAGGAANRDINNFIEALPSTFLGRCSWAVRRPWRRLRRRVDLSLRFQEIKGQNLNYVAKHAR